MKHNGSLLLLIRHIICLELQILQPRRGEKTESKGSPERKRHSGQQWYSYIFTKCSLKKEGKWLRSKQSGWEVVTGDVKMKMKVKVKVPLFFIVEVVSFVGGSSFSVVRQWDLARLNMLDILHKHLIVPLHLLHSLPTHSPGHVLPAVRGVLVIHHQSILEQFVLLGSPVIWTRSHFWICTQIVGGGRSSKDRKIELYGQTHLPATALYRGEKRERKVVIGGVGGRWGSFSCWSVAFLADLQISPCFLKSHVLSYNFQLILIYDLL